MQYFLFYIVETKNYISLQQQKTKNMREIKFRGLKKSDNTWIVGDLNHIYGKPYIFDRETSLNSTDDYEVIPKTVGQFIGLRDKNGVEIYEGDLVKVDSSGVGGAFQDGVYKVSYFLLDCCFCLEQLDGQHAIPFNECYDYEVIGNIHETQTT